MPLLKIQPFSAPTGGGVSISQGETKSRAYFRISVTQAIQEAHLGGPVDPSTHGLVLVVNNDKDTRHLMGIKVAPLSAPGSMAVTKTPKGGISLRVNAWLAATGKRPAVTMPIVNAAVQGGGVSVKLPEWARAAAVYSPV